MIAKFIRCRVSDEDRESFSRAQLKWTKIAECEGFLGQVGGWDDVESDIVIIIAFFSDMKSVDKFMRDYHDSLLAASNQSDTYEDLEVVYLQNIEALSPYPDIPFAGGQQINFIRVADFIVNAKNSQRFVKKQLDVWHKAIEGVEGICGGHLWQDTEDQSRYFVMPLWTNSHFHQHYTDLYFPTLAEKAKLAQFVESMRGHLVHLEPDWYIPANSNQT